VYHGERFNGYTHLAGAALAAAGASFLLASQALDAWKASGIAIYGATLLILFAVSTLYHSTRGRAKAVLRKLDHCAIYLLIAGTYTPFALVTLRGAWGWSLLGLAWGLAVLGIAQELLMGKGARVLSLGERFLHFHGVWHLFVLAGSSSHFVAVAGYVA
jgi:hemolysin III